MLGIRVLKLVAIAILVAVANLSALSHGAAQAAGNPAFQALNGADATDFVLPLDMEPVTSFRLGAYSLTYERYQQTFGEAKVLGGQITLYRNDAGQVTLVIGAHYPDIAPSNSVELNKADAQAVADRELGSRGERRVDLMINPDDGRYFFRVESRGPSSRWVHWIGAQSGQVINRYNALTHGTVATCDGTVACGYGVEYDESATGDVKNLSGLTSPSGGGYELVSQDGRQETHDQGSSNRPFFGPIATDDDNAWTDLGDESPAQQALVDAHYYSYVTDQYLLLVHGFDWVGEFGGPMRIEAHFYRKYDNAFWDGTVVAFGDGGGTSYREFTSLDIVGHELTHAVTEMTSNLIYQYEPGALNEAFSDIIGTSVEFYADTNDLEPGAATAVGGLLQPDWFIAEDLDLRNDAVPGFRNMADPEEDGDPDHYSERYTGGSDSGGVHINSAIANHAYYLLVNGGANASCASKSDHNSAHCTGGIGDVGSEVPGIGFPAAEEIFFIGFTGLTTNSDMCDARDATIAAASLGANRDATTDAWAAVGLDAAQCGGVADNPPNNVNVTTPNDSDVVSGTVGITAIASDDNGVTQVKFFIDGASLHVDNTDDGWTASWDTTLFSEGGHSITAEATDTIGQTTLRVRPETL